MYSVPGSLPGKKKFICIIIDYGLSSTFLKFGVLNPLTWSETLGFTY